MSTDNMLYNSQMDLLTISEYGRNIQNMINVVRDIEDDKKRQDYAEAIVSLMHQMHPTDKNNPDSRIKLWRHLFKIANYDINVTPPDGIIPTPDNTTLQPGPIEYPEGTRKFRHYGKNVQVLVEKALSMEDSDKKEEFVMIIAAYMKLAYRTWNREHFVSDDVIKQDLETMSNGEIKISDDDSIVVTAPMPSATQFKRRKGSSNKSGGRRNNNYRSNGRSNGSRNNGGGQSNRSNRR
jgi:hypothetical protein